MKLELNISDELWKRIEERASLFNLPPADFVRQLLEQHVPPVHDRNAAVALLEEFAAARDVCPQDDYEVEEFLEAIERNRGRIRPPVTRANGEPTP